MISARLKVPLLVALLVVRGGAVAQTAPQNTSETKPKIDVGALFQLGYRATLVSVVPKLKVLVETEYPETSVATETLRAIRDTARESDGLALRRASLLLNIEPYDRFRIVFDFDAAQMIDEENLSHGVRETFVEARPIEPATARAGIFDVPFTLLELESLPSFEFAEEPRTHELVEHLGFAGREVGASLDLAPLPESDRLEISAGVFQGAAVGAQEYRAPGLLAGRLEAEPIEALRVGGSISWRPWPVDAWWEELRFRYQERRAGVAYSAHAELLLEQLTVRTEIVAGDRTDNDVEAPLLLRRGEARTFVGAWGMAAVRLPVAQVVLIPAGRAEWLDVDRESDVGALLRLSVGLNVDLSERVRTLVELSRQYVQPGTKNWEFDIVRYDTDSTSGVLQLQLVF